jgi:hypothetical protein
MKGVRSMLKALSKALASGSNEVTSTSFFNVSEERQLPVSVIYSINSICAERLWNWTGDFNHLAEDPHLKQVTMYTSDGAMMIVQINSEGKVKSINPKVGDNFYKYPELSFSGPSILIKTFNYSG